MRTLTIMSKSPYHGYGYYYDTFKGGSKGGRDDLFWGETIPRPFFPTVRAPRMDASKDRSYPRDAKLSNRKDCHVEDNETRLGTNHATPVLKNKMAERYLYLGLSPDAKIKDMQPDLHDIFISASQIVCLATITGSIAASTGDIRSAAKCVQRSLPESWLMDVFHDRTDFDSLEHANAFDPESHFETKFCYNILKKGESRPPPIKKGVVGKITLRQESIREPIPMKHIPTGQKGFIFWPPVLVSASWAPTPDAVLPR